MAFERVFLDFEAFIRCGDVAFYYKSLLMLTSPGGGGYLLFKLKACTPRVLHLNAMRIMAFVSTVYLGTWRLD